MNHADVYHDLIYCLERPLDHVFHRVRYCMSLIDASSSIDFNVSFCENKRTRPSDFQPMTPFHRGGINYRLLDRVPGFPYSVKHP
jgi:hypothetical protein